MVDISGRPVIGQRAKDQDESFGEVWIRGFRAGETQLRILENTDDWWGYKEHYGGSREIGYFPCSRQPDCVGCNDVSERVRGVTNKYAFNALCDDGKVRVFKLGSRTRNKLKMAEQRLGADILQRRDILIIRMGTGFGDTQYDTEWGDEYALDNPPEETEINNLGEVITAKYVVAEMQMKADPNGEHDEDGFEVGDDAQPPAETETEQPKAAAKKTAAKKAAPAQRRRLGGGGGDVVGDTEEPKRGRLGGGKPAESNEPVADDAGEPEGTGEPEDAGEPADEAQASAPPANAAKVDAAIAKLGEEETDDIRERLKASSVDFPPRAPRAKVIEIATEAMRSGVMPPW